MSRPESERPAWVRPLLLVAGVVVLAVAVRTLPVARWLESSEGWILGLGALGPAVFCALYVAAALAFVPGSLVTLLAGAFFGPWLGTAIVSVASTTAAALAFLLARGVLRKRVEGWAAERPRFAAIDAAIRDEGWKVVGLLRLSPVVPFSLGNYLFGLTPVRLAPYVVVSWVAMLPGTFLYVYIGHAGRAAAGGATDTGRWVLLGVGLLATVLVTVVLSRAARRRLARSEPLDAP